MTEPRRGEVWWIAFDPSVGTEVQKTRPAVIVSNNDANDIISRVQAVPLTTNVRAVHPGQALVTLKGIRQKAMADQIDTVSKQRLRGLLGRLSSSDLVSVEAAIREQLDL